MNRRLGVCSWSLQPDSPEELVEQVRALGLAHVQLALNRLHSCEWDEGMTVAALRDGGIEVRSGMMETVSEDYSTLETIRATGGVRRDEHWAENLDIARGVAAIARRLGIKLVSLHAGFLPEERGDAEREVMLGRFRSIADVFAEHGVQAALETGQESAATLLDVLDELGRPDVGVNFDPANMILYDKGDPIEALRRLLPHVRQIHVKDAVRTTTPGTWGTEVVAGTGEVDWEGFFSTLRDRGVGCDLMIEREAGDDRVGDIRQARELVGNHLPEAIR